MALCHYRECPLVILMGVEGGKDGPHSVNRRATGDTQTTENGGRKETTQAGRVFDRRCRPVLDMPAGQAGEEAVNQFDYIWGDLDAERASLNRSLIRRLERTERRMRFWMGVAVLFASALFVLICVLIGG